ncbi:PTS sugar transporter subunit IIA [Enterobacter sp.]|uniref:PTS sugar transporter subunit IIA n=1 Tax=Enterobacter sp. TaxID=42895 RepID=UPI00296EB8B0|nr:PTS sugar transporter subunit IIA [Enterobacter sp.]
MLLDASPVDKSEAIKRLTDNLHIQQRVLSGDDAERAIWQREEVFTTALGFSVAIPHCKSPAITHSSISVMRLTEPVAWGGDVDVQLIIMLTISEHEADRHMRIFSALARKLMHESFRQQLMTVATPEAMVTMLSAELGL